MPRKPISHTPRSRKLLESYGCIVDRTEHWNAFARKRIDLFNVFDLLAIDQKQDVLIGVQVTTRAHLSDRKAKILASAAAKAWMQTGAYIHIHGWDKKGDGRKWDCKIIVLAKEDFTSPEIVGEINIEPCLETL